MPTPTPGYARAVLHNRADTEQAEERHTPPSWAPFTAMHPTREIHAAREAARTRVEHALRLADLPDGALSQMLADGWHPHGRTVTPGTVRPTRQHETSPRGA